MRSSAMRRPCQSEGEGSSGSGPVDADGMRTVITISPAGTSMSAFKRPLVGLQPDPAPAVDRDAAGDDERSGGADGRSPDQARSGAQGTVLEAVQTPV